MTVRTHCRLRRGAIAFALLASCLSLAPAGADPAGALEPGYRGWLHIDTPHFVIIYEPRDQYAAAQIAGVAERAYSAVTGFLGSRPDKVWIVVSGRVDTTNAYTTPIPAHIEVYLSPPSEPLVALDADSNLELLLVHELTHYVNFQYGRGFFSVLSRVLGPAVDSLNMAFLPVWFIEGIATQDETRLTDGGRGRNPFFAMEYRAMVHDRAYFSLHQAAYTPNTPPYDRDWTGGYLLFQYLFEHYGEGVFRRIHDDFARFPFLGPGGAIRRATGVSEEELYRRAISELETSFSAEQDTPAGQRISPAGDGDTFLPVITARGWYEYRTSPKDGAEIVAVDPASQAVRVIRRTAISDTTSLTAPADGTRIVFASFTSTVGRSGSILASDLYRLDPDSGAVTRITEGRHLWEPRLSPDGSMLLAVQGVGSESRLVSVDEQTGGVSVLFSRRGTAVSGPQFSPDGSRILFDLQEHGEWSIWTMAAAKTGAKESAGRPVEDYAAAPAHAVAGLSRAYYPRFIDGNTRILYSAADGNGVLTLYSVAPDGTARRTVCADPVGAWAGEADGNDILYASYRTGGYAVYRFSAAGAGGGLTSDGGPASNDGPASDGGATSAGPSGSRAPTIGGDGGEGMAAPGGAPDSGGARAPAVAATASDPAAYRDVLRFLGWFPIPVYYGGSAPADLVFAPGAFFAASSTLGKNSLTGALTFRTDVLQPGVELSYGGVFGTVSFSYDFSEGYAELGSTYAETFVQSAGIAVPLVEQSLLGMTTQLVAQLALTDIYEIHGPSSFSFTEGFSAGTEPSLLAAENQLLAGTSISFSRQRDSSALDMFGAGGTDLSAAATFYPPSLSPLGPAALLQGSASFSIPSFIPHQVLRLGLKSSYATLPVPFPEITTPRGEFDTVEQYEPGRSLAAIDYLMPVSLLDVPLVYSLGLVGIGAGLHVEAAADWNPMTGDFTPDAELYAGAEILFDLAAGESSFPVDVGVTLKLDPTGRRPFDWATDLRPYVGFSTDSFDASARQTVSGTISRASEITADQR